MQVPSYGNFQVSPQPHGVGEWSTEIPRAPDTGLRASIDKASQKLDAFTERLIAEQDQARVTEALTDLRRKAVDLQAGEQGFRKLLGKNALDPDQQGRGLVERADTELQEYGSAIAAKLTPRQQKLFGERALNVYQSNFASATEHVFTQDVAYQQEVHTSALAQYVESGTTYAAQPELAAETEAGIKESVDRLSALRGYTPEQRELLRRQQTSAFYANGIAQILSQADANPSIAYRASGLLQANAKKMLGSDVAKLRTQINGYLETAESYQLADGFGNLTELGFAEGGDAFLTAERGSLIKSGHSTTAIEALTLGVVPVGGSGQENTERGDGPADYRYGLTKLTVEQGMAAAKAAGVEWDQKAFLHDRAYNIKLGAHRMDQMEAAYGGDMTKALAAYRYGEKTVDDAVKKAEADGSPGAWVNQLSGKQQDWVNDCLKSMQSAERAPVKDESGNVVDAFNPGYAARTRTWKTEDEARAYVLAASPRARFDPVFREQTVTRAMAMQNSHKQSYEQKQQERIGQAVDFLYANGGNLALVPTSVWQNLTWPEQQSLLKVSKKMTAQDDTTNIRLFMTYMKDDGALLGLTERQVKNLRPSLSSADFEKVYARWSALKVEAGMAADKRTVEVRQAQIGQLDSAYGKVSLSDIDSALEGTIEGYREFKKKNPEAADAFLYEASNIVARNDQLKGTATKGVQNVGLALQQMIRGSVSVASSVPFFSNDEKNLFEVTAKDLPNRGPTDARALVTNLARTRLGHEPSDTEVQRELWRIFMDKNYIVRMPEAVLSDPLVQHIQEEARKQLGRDLSGPDLLRQYLTERLKGTRTPSKKTEDSYYTNRIVGSDAFDPYYDS